MRENRVIIITGVSKGIGRATAELLCSLGYRVVGWGRNAPPFEHPSFRFIGCDVTEPDQVNAALEETLNLWGSSAIYGLINNAGFGLFGRIEELPIDDWYRMFNTNVHGLMLATRALVPILKQNGLGHIINISSIAGLQAMAQTSAYCATKFAVRGFSHSLYAELREFGVKVSCVYPGSVSTNFFDLIPGIEPNEHMLRSEDVANLLRELLETSPNFLTVDVEIRPLKPGGGRK